MERTANGAVGLALRRQGRILVRHHPRLPPVAAVGQPQDLGWGLVLVAGAERTIGRERNRRLGCTTHHHFIGTLGAIGGNHHPFFGHEVLPQLGHRLRTSVKTAMTSFYGTVQTEIWQRSAWSSRPGSPS